jgi:ABC-type arginine/histidine transport system permease subunit
MRVGRNVEVRALGGLPGCLAMIAASVVISVLLTLLLNLAR